MRSIEIGVVPKKEGDKIPVDVAGNVMVNIQALFRHVGEYLIVQELRLQSKIDSRLSDMFDLFIDPSSGITLRSATKISTSGIIDEALALLEETLTKPQSGPGAYWISERFADPRFRRLIADDLISLIADLGPDHDLKLGNEVLKKMDLGSLKSYSNGLKMICDDVVCGVPRASNTKSRRPDIRLAMGADRAKLSFADKTAESEVGALLNKAALVGGRVKYGDEGIVEISEIKKVLPFETLSFRRMISSEGDVSLTVPLEVKVGFDWRSEEWSIHNSSIGALISKKDWDLTVTAFHDYFIFLWNEYASGTKDLTAEEKEVKDFLLGLVITK